MQLKLALEKERFFLLLAALILLGGCSESGCPNYEPIYLNETNANVSFLYGTSDDGFNRGDSLIVPPNDTAYRSPGEYFPFLQESGLRWSDDSPLYDVRLVFYPNTDSSRCLVYEGKNFKPNDVRKFSSYRDIGECDFCVERGECQTIGMLYRITDDMLESAGPCE